MSMQENLFNIDVLRALLKTIMWEVAYEIEATREDREKESSEVMDVKEAAAFLKKKVSTIYGMTSSREIPHYKQGKKLYFLRSELIEWISQGKTKTREELSDEGLQSLYTNHRRRRRRR